MRMTAADALGDGVGRRRRTGLALCQVGSWTGCARDPMSNAGMLADAFGRVDGRPDEPVAS